MKVLLAFLFIAATLPAYAQVSGAQPEICVTSSSQTPNYNRTCLRASENGGAVDVSNFGTATGNLAFTKNGIGLSGGVNVKQFGALCDGITDDSIAIQAAVDSLPNPVGGSVYFPACVHPYIVNANAITTRYNHQPITFYGDGWSSVDCSPFGMSSWLTLNDVTGTLIRVTGTTDGFFFGAPLYNQNYVFRDLAIVGPGTGTSKGINFGGPLPSTATYITLQNILVANFSSCVYRTASDSDTFINLNVRGCGIGVDQNFGGTDHNFYRLVAECNGVGVVIAGPGQHIYGGLIQGNTVTGIHVAGNAGAINAVSIDGVWFEANTGGGVLLDTSAFGITNFSISNSRSSAAGDGIVFTGTAANVNTPTFRNLAFGSAAMTLPNIVLNAVVENSFFASFTDNSNTSFCATLINVAPNGANKFSCTYTVIALPNPAASGAGAQAFVSNANAACTFGTIPVGGGSTFCRVTSDGTNWREY